MKRAMLVGTAVMMLGMAASRPLLAQSASPAPPVSRVEPAQVIGNAPPSASMQRTGVSAERARTLAVEAGAAGQAGVPAQQRRRLIRGKPLPTDVPFQRPPAEMLLKLPVYRGYEWRMVGWDLVLIQPVSTVVNDIVFEVFK